MMNSLLVIFIHSLCVAADIYYADNLEAKYNIVSGRSAFTKLKDKFPSSSISDCVYGITCLDCGGLYIQGQTSQNIKRRITLHKSDVRLHADRCALAIHATKMSHHFDFDKFKVLDIAGNYQKRIFLEMCHINDNDSGEKHWTFGSYQDSEFYEIIKRFDRLNRDVQDGLIHKLISSNSQGTEAVHFYEFRRSFRPVTLEGKGLIIQFKVHYKKIFSCSGGYVELLGCPYNSETEVEKLDDKSLYNISFGLDLCDSNVVNLNVHWNRMKMKNESIHAKFHDSKQIYTMLIKDTHFKIIINEDAENTDNFGDRMKNQHFHEEKKWVHDEWLSGKICAAQVSIWQLKSGTSFDDIVIIDDTTYIEKFETNFESSQRTGEVFKNNSSKEEFLPLLDEQNRNLKSGKIFMNAEEVLADIKNESSLLLGGFGICGIPENLINGLQNLNIGNLTVISSHAGIDHFGLGALLAQHKIRKIIASAVGRNEEFQKQYLDGELEVELTPQGTLAEKIRAARSGIPAFYTPAGYGTLLQEGKIPVKYKKTGEVEFYSEPKKTEYFDGKPYILERAISADFALIKAWKADIYGNLVFHESARNFNAIMAAAAKITIVEAEHILNAGDINPNEIHTPGIYVDRIIQGKSYEKRIEKIVSPNKDETEVKEQYVNYKVEKIIKRAVLEFENGMYVNLGIGIPQLASNYIPKNITVFLHSENGILGLGPYPRLFEVDPDLINAGKEAITVIPGSSYVDSAESFAMIRGGHVDMTMLGALEVSKFGDLANWLIPDKLVKGMGGAMDLVTAPNMKIIVLMEHNSEDGSPKILDECNFPLTGKGCVSLIITEKCVFSVDRHTGLTLIEISDDQSIEDIKAHTESDFAISPELRQMKQLNVS